MLINSAVTFVGLMTLAAYGWSVRGHFSSPATPSGAWLITLAVVASAALLLWCTWTTEPPFAASCAGLVIQLASSALFVAAIRASRRAKLRFVFDPAFPHGLIETGPYRYVRHPFYVSYCLFWIGWTVAAWSIIALPVPVIMLGLYAFAARMEERNFAASPLSEEHAAYRKRVGFFVPRLWR